MWRDALLNCLNLDCTSDDGERAYEAAFANLIGMLEAEA